MQPLQQKVDAILKIDTPKNRKELRSFIGVVNYYRDMWIRRSHVLAPLTIDQANVQNQQVEMD